MICICIYKYILHIYIIFLISFQHLFRFLILVFKINTVRNVIAAWEKEAQPIELPSELKNVHMYMYIPIKSVVSAKLTIHSFAARNCTK